MVLSSFSDAINDIGSFLVWVVLPLTVLYFIISRAVKKGILDAIKHIDLMRFKADEWHHTPSRITHTEPSNVDISDEGYAELKVCQKCGAKNPFDGAYCISCGNKLL